MTYQEAYEILEITENSSEEEIKIAYRKQAKKYHPDIYIGNKNFAEGKMAQINEAYSLLIKPNPAVTSNNSSYNTAYQYDSYQEEVLRDFYETLGKIRQDLEEQEKWAKRYLYLFSVTLYIIFLAFSTSFIIRSLQFIFQTFNTQQLLLIIFFGFSAFIFLAIIIIATLTLIWFIRKVKNDD